MVRGSSVGHMCTVRSLDGLDTPAIVFIQGSLLEIDSKIKACVEDGVDLEFHHMDYVIMSTTGVYLNPKMTYIYDDLDGLSIEVNSVEIKVLGLIHNLTAEEARKIH